MKLKPIIKKVNWLSQGVVGLTIFPFIFVSKKHWNHPKYRDQNGRLQKVLINHETIHFKQQIETLVLPFFILYIGHYIWNIFTKYGFDFNKCYRNVVFEKEAYDKERDFKYPEYRHPWGFWKYFRE